MTKSDKNFELWLRKSTNGQKLDALLRGQRTIILAQNLDYQMEKQQMADFKELEDEVKATRGAAESVKVFVAGLETKLAELGAGMSDEEDQAKVAAFAKEFAEIRATLPKAVEANPGASTGGARPID